MSNLALSHDVYIRHAAAHLKTSLAEIFRILDSCENRESRNVKSNEVGLVAA